MTRDRKSAQRLKRHKRIRLKVKGDNLCPRLVVHRSLKNFQAQVVDDTKNKTLFSFSTAQKPIKEKFPYGGNVKAAEFFGQFFAAKVKEKGINKIIFDRAGYAYHGRIKAFADALRKGGLEF